MARVPALLLALAACLGLSAAVELSLGKWGDKCKTRANCGEGVSLACVDGFCQACARFVPPAGLGRSLGAAQFCKYDGECGSYEVCHSLDESRTLAVPGNATAPPASYAATECVRKPLFPMSTYDWLVTFAVFVAGALAAGGGIGGGGLMVPLFVVVGQFDAKDAIPLSSACIFGGSLANLAFFIR
jgi:hypothetical protein